MAEVGKWWNVPPIVNSYRKRIPGTLAYDTVQVFRMGNSFPLLNPIQSVDPDNHVSQQDVENYRYQFPIPQPNITGDPVWDPDLLDPAPFSGKRGSGFSYDKLSWGPARNSNVLVAYEIDVMPSLLWSSGVLRFPYNTKSDTDPIIIETPAVYHNRYPYVWLSHMDQDAKEQLFYSGLTTRDSGAGGCLGFISPFSEGTEGLAYNPPFPEPPGQPPQICQCRQRPNESPLEPPHACLCGASCWLGSYTIFFRRMNLPNQLVQDSNNETLVPDLGPNQGFGLENNLDAGTYPAVSPVSIQQSPGGSGTGNGNVTSTRMGGWMPDMGKPFQSGWAPRKNDHMRFHQWRESLAPGEPFHRWFKWGRLGQVTNSWWTGVQYLADPLALGIDDELIFSMCPPQSSPSTVGGLGRTLLNEDDANPAPRMFEATVKLYWKSAADPAELVPFLRRN